MRGSPRGIAKGLRGASATTGGISEVLISEGSRFTKEEMLRLAASAGLPADGTLFDRWVTQGLLDAAQTEGRGYRSGVLRTWPGGQAQLWLTLLSKRREGAKPRDLANGPVFIWLLWGEDYVPLRQVRRVVETWAEVGRKAPRHDYRHAARRLVKDVAAPGVDHHARDALVEALVDSARARDLDEERVEALVRRVVGARDASAEVDGPRIFESLRAQFAGVRTFAKFGNAEFKWARALYLVASQSYARDWPQLAADPRFGRLYEPYDAAHIVNGAAGRIVFILGLSEVMPPSASLPEVLTLDAWRSDRVHLGTNVEQQRSPIWTPAGYPVTGLHIEIELSIEPAASR